MGKIILFLLGTSITTAAVPTTRVQGINLLTHETLTISSEGAQGLVVVFLSARCPCSKSHNDELQDLAKLHPRFRFVAVHSNVDESPELSRAYFEKQSFSFPVLQDEDAKLADRLRALKTPHAFLFGPQGDVLYQGGVSSSKDCTKADRKYLREALADLEAGRAVGTPEGRTLGCAISRGPQKLE